MRKVRIRRETKEVDINVELNIDGEGKYRIDTGIDFLNHMLSLFSKHGSFDLKVRARGDLGVDIHHTNEDIGIVLGEAFRKALGGKKNINRFGWAFVCMDDALARAVVDISGRPSLKIKYPKFKGLKEPLGYSFNYFEQFMKAFSSNAKITLHLEVLEGEDFHHILEVCFKSLSLALRQAASRQRRGLLTTKGKID